MQIAFIGLVMAAACAAATNAAAQDNSRKALTIDPQAAAAPQSDARAPSSYFDRARAGADWNLDCDQYRAPKAISSPADLDQSGPPPLADQKVISQKTPNPRRLDATTDNLMPVLDGIYRATALAAERAQSADARARQLQIEVDLLRCEVAQANARIAILAEALALHDPSLAGPKPGK